MLPKKNNRKPWGGIVKNPLSFLQQIFWFRYSGLNISTHSAVLCAVGTDTNFNNHHSVINFTEREANYNHIIAVDLNSDDFTDILVASSSTLCSGCERIAWFRNEGGADSDMSSNGGYTITTEIGFVIDLRAVDVDGDLDNDIIVIGACTWYRCEQLSHSNTHTVLLTTQTLKGTDRTLETVVGVGIQIWQESTSGYNSPRVPAVASKSTKKWSFLLIWMELQWCELVFEIESRRKCTVHPGESCQGPSISTWLSQTGVTFGEKTVAFQGDCRSYNTVMQAD